MARAERLRREPEDRRAPRRDAARCSNAEARPSPQLPALLALQEPGHLPRDRAVVPRADASATTDACARRALDARSTQHARWIPPGGATASTAMIENRPDWCCRASASGACRSRRSTARVRRGAARRRRSMRARRGACSRARAPTRGSRGAAASSLPPGSRARAAAGATFEQGRDISTCGSSRASSWRVMREARLRRRPRPTSISTSRAPTSTAAGSTRSLLVGIARARARALTRRVLTHGFVLDERRRGRCRSRSATMPYATGRSIEKYGAECCACGRRAVDYRDDVRSPRDPAPQLRRGVPQDPQHLPLPARKPRRLRPEAPRGGGR